MVHMGRLFSFLSYVVFGASCGFFWGVAQLERQSMTALLWGGMLTAFAWVALDAWRGYRIRSWLRHGDLSIAPQTTGWWGLLLDRARRLLREKEKAVQNSEQRLRDFLSAIQASPNGVVMLDAKGQIEWCNATASTQLGISPERDVMQRIGNLIRDPAFTAYMQEESPSDPAVIAGREHRADRPVRISVQRHSYGEGKQLLLTRDVTLLEQAEAMRRDFVANVSHEIRTPLTVLSGFVETMQTLSLSDAEQKHYLELMAVQAHRMQGLVADLLTLSRLEGSPVPGFDESIQLSFLLKTCEQEALGLSATMAEGGEPQEIHFDTGNALAQASLLGAPREITSAVSNLVSNAVRYTPCGGRITVGVQMEHDNALSIEVRDTGPGIGAEHLPRLTERFYRVDRSRSRESGGTGLGLAIVKHVMQRHGGQLLISSELGKGSVFKLVFPAGRWLVSPSLNV
jgi:two-component system phosphate regulon sensor histidine kinase PhoR